MILSDIINVVGITVYTLLALFFLWVYQVSSTFTRSHYWLFAVLLVLIARINLYLFPAFLLPSSTNIIYAICITLEKVFIILGLLYFLKKNVALRYINKLLIFSLTNLICLISLIFYFEDDIYFLVWFSTSQTIYLLLEAFIFWRNKQNPYINNRPALLFILFCYALLWLTFPIAVNFPSWLPLGYLLGNGLNLFVYLTFAYLVISRFQHRVKKAEKSAHLRAKEARQASNAKSEFLANMSHEIRTPMNGVISMLELLEHEPLTENQHARVSLALKSGRGLLDIINDILDFSKIEAGKLKIEQFDFDIVTLLEEITSVMKTLANDKNLEFILDTSAMTHRMVNSDPVRVKQIMLNLAGNAIKFTDRGKIVLKAAIKRSEQGLNFECAVIDTGVGIEQDKLSTVFTSFNQADTSTTRHYGGTGLGLSITKRLCNLMEGNITVTSTINKGSEFCVSFPVKESTNVALKFDPSLISTLNVLVVESDQTNREIIQNLLEYWKINVVMVHTSNDALAICQKAHHFDIVFIDINMPIMDGKRLAKAIKSLPNCDQIKVILLLPEVANNDPAQASNNDIEHVLIKPIMFSNLFDVLQQVTYHLRKNISTSRTASDKQFDTGSITRWNNQSRILLVEDNKINQAVAKQVLNHFNLTCEIAGNGVEAIVKLKVANEANLPYSLVFMDCQMPIMDGYEATQKIRNGDCGTKNKTIPIVAMTANAMTGDREKCLAVGMNDYLTKPIEKDKLLQVIKQWIASE